MYGLFDFKNDIIPLKIKIIEKTHTVLLPDLWFLSCNKKFLKFFEIKKSKFWEHKFFSIVTFK